MEITPVILPHLTLHLILLLHERSRELYWEADSRTDLIRFGKFTSGRLCCGLSKAELKAELLWAISVNLFPIPVSDITVNPNLNQNTGY